MNGEAYRLFFRALANDTRLDIIENLKKRPMSVGELAKAAGFEQSRISHNLRILETWGFVTANRRGKNRIYALDDGSIRPILDGIDRYMETYEQRLATCGILQGKKTCPHMAADTR